MFPYSLGRVWRAWLGSWPGRGRRRVASVRRKVALGLEALEDRALLTSLTVTTVSDTPQAGQLTLSQAIGLANSYSTFGAGPTTITFAPGVSGAIVPDGGTLPTITGNVTISGPGAGSLAVSHATSHAFNIAPGATVALSGLTISYDSDGSFLGSGDGGGGGVFNRGTLTVSDCDFTNDRDTAGLGSALFNAGGSVTVLRTTFSGNTTSTGGTIANVAGSLTLIDCTVAHNAATGPNGGVGILNATGAGQYAGGPTALALVGCTVADNNGGYGLLNDGGSATYEDTIFARNGGVQGKGTFLTTYNVYFPGGTVTSLGHNLSDDSTGNLDPRLGDLPGTDPLLAPLGSYGGATPTMALLPGSPAIDAGDRLGPTTDQRGVARSDGRPDIGAFESRGFTVTLSGGQNPQALVNTAFAVPLQVTVTSSYGEPVAGGLVTFTAPAGGPGAAFGGNPAALDAGGHAAVTATANGTAGSYPVTVALGAAHAALLLTNLPAIALTPAALPGGTAGAAYGQALSAAGGRGGPFQFAVTAGALPAGLSLSAAGLLGGTTTAAGTFTFTVTATGAGGFTGLQTYQLIIDPSSPGTPPGPSPTPAAPADPPGTLPPGNAAPQPSPGRPPRHTRHRGRKRKAGGHSRHPGRPRGRAPRA